jgi:two-component system, OmpR family, sensor histidine kinase CreC
VKLGIRLLLAFFLINGLAAFFVLRVFVAEVKPSVRQVVEDLMVDSAHLLADLARDELIAGTLAKGTFAQRVMEHGDRPVQARIWGLDKTSLDLRVYVTDAKGIVLFDSYNVAQGEDFSQWRDVARTLRGEYGARATRAVADDDSSTVLYVAAPIVDDRKHIIGSLTVGKAVSSLGPFITRAERKIMVAGAWLMGLSALIGIIVTAWIVWSIRRLRAYAQHAEAGARQPVPQLSGELGELAKAMGAMRERLEGREYVEGYVRALTHELKSPIAAIRGSAELLQDDLPAEDRTRFGAQITAQTARLQQLVDHLLELSKLEQRQALADAQPVDIATCAERVAAAAQPLAQQRGVHIQLQLARTHAVQGEAALIELAASNVLANAIEFSPQGGTVELSVEPRPAGVALVVRDQGPGMPDYALARLGERFFSTARPNGRSKGSGLGLAIVRQVMQLHKGDVHIHNLDRGLQVKLVFPA